MCQTFPSFVLIILPLVIFSIYYLSVRAELGNTSPAFVIEPEFAGAVWKTTGLYFLVWHDHIVNSLLDEPCKQFIV